MVCGFCCSRIRIHKNDKGRIKVYCSGRAQGGQCTCKGIFLDVYESQVEWYLDQFEIPDDYQQRILEWYTALGLDHKDAAKLRVKLDGRLRRTKDMYGWGDITEEEYRNQRDAINQELNELPIENQDERTLERFANVLKSVKTGWTEASQAQRNRLARVLFEEVKVQDKQVLAVKPVKELEAFFGVSYDCQQKSLAGDPDRIRTGDLCLHSFVGCKLSCLQPRLFISTEEHSTFFNHLFSEDVRGHMLPGRLLANFQHLTATKGACEQAVTVLVPQVKDW